MTQRMELVGDRYDPVTFVPADAGLANVIIPIADITAQRAIVIVRRPPQKRMGADRSAPIQVARSYLSYLIS